MRRHTLAAGESLVGSSVDCAVRILDPTVSRRHARLCVEGERVTVEDLGSRNGTRIGGRTIVGLVELEGGIVLSFGGVTALVARVDEDDLEPALLLQPANVPTVASDVFDLVDSVTASVEPFSHFVRDRLVDLIDALRAGVDEMTLVSAVGSAMAETLPCLGLEIHDRERCLWQMKSGVTPDVGAAGGRETTEGGLRLCYQLPSDRLAELFQPLAALALGLLELRRRRAEPRLETPPRPLPPAPPLPVPASIEPVMTRIYRDAARIAQGDVSVLIRGESGTGKEVLAGWLHRASARSEGPFLALNCAALPRELLEAELFGIERGVATGVEARQGMFERASGGTLMLDEVGDMATETQTKLLRALEVGELFRVGGRSPYPVDVRIIAATNRDLDVLMTEGVFRSDLYFRIADWEVELPPLRERPGDIPQMAGHFLGEESDRHGRRIRGISRAAMAALRQFDWPGNVRQLRKEMSRVALLIGPGELLDSARLDPPIAAAGRTRSLKDTLQTAERKVIERTLDACDGDRALAASRLGMSDITLYRRIKAYDLG
jgi:hypothetical protein